MNNHDLTVRVGIGIPSSCAHCVAVSNEEVLEDLGQLGVPERDDRKLSLASRRSGSSHFLLIGPQDLQTLPKNLYGVSFGGLTTLMPQAHHKGFVDVSCFFQSIPGSLGVLGPLGSGQVNDRQAGDLG